MEVEKTNGGSSVKRSLFGPTQEKVPTLGRHPSKKLTFKEVFANRSPIRATFQKPTKRKKKKKNLGTLWVEAKNRSEEKKQLQQKKECFGQKICRDALEGGGG